MARKLKVKDASGRVVGTISRQSLKRAQKKIRRAKNINLAVQRQRAAEQAAKDLAAGLPATFRTGTGEVKTIKVTKTPREKLRRIFRKEQRSIERQLGQAALRGDKKKVKELKPLLESVKARNVLERQERRKGKAFQREITRTTKELEAAGFKTAGDVLKEFKPKSNNFFIREGDERFLKAGGFFPDYLRESTGLTRALVLKSLEDQKKFNIQKELNKQSVKRQAKIYNDFFDNLNNKQKNDLLKLINKDNQWKKQREKRYNNIKGLIEKGQTGTPIKAIPKAARERVNSVLATILTYVDPVLFGKELGVGVAKAITLQKLRNNYAQLAPSIDRQFKLAAKQSGISVKDALKQPETYLLPLLPAIVKSKSVSSKLKATSKTLSVKEAVRDFNLFSFKDAKKILSIKPSKNTFPVELLTKKDLKRLGLQNVPKDRRIPINDPLIALKRIKYKELGFPSPDTKIEITPIIEVPPTKFYKKVDRSALPKPFTETFFKNLIKADMLARRKVVNQLSRRYEQIGLKPKEAKARAKKVIKDKLKKASKKTAVDKPKASGQILASATGFKEFKAAKQGRISTNFQRVINNEKVNLQVVIEQGTAKVIATTEQLTAQGLRTKQVVLSKVKITKFIPNKTALKALSKQLITGALKTKQAQLLKQNIATKQRLSQLQEISQKQLQKQKTITRTKQKTITKQITKTKLRTLQQQKTLTEQLQQLKLKQVIPAKPGKKKPPTIKIPKLKPQKIKKLKQIKLKKLKQQVKFTPTFIRPARIDPTIKTGKGFKLFTGTELR